MQWDIFCRVIDNFGDLGVCWRLASQLARRGQGVRLWVDDARALSWLAPAGAAGVQVCTWRTPLALQGVRPGDVLVEAFGCNIDPEFIAAYVSNIKAKGQKCSWINLEYLSAEGYVRRCHGLPSPVMNGPGRGLTKHFFYPGFTDGTGGLLREPDLPARQAQFDRAAWLAQRGVAWHGERLISLFCYEPAALTALLRQLAGAAQPTHLLVTAGRAATAVRLLVANEISLNPLWNKHNMLLISYLPTLAQDDFDHLLWAGDVNFVRGEDSLVRALWAGQPLLWQIYPQDDQAHLAKLDAWLDWLGAPASLRRAHARWNADARAPLAAGVQAAADALFDDADLASWRTTIRAARARLLAQNDLCSQLIDRVQSP